METKDLSIDRGSYLPLYAQVRHQILKMIAEHTDPAAPIFTDEELAKQFGITRMTVRQAVRTLVDEGVLCRVRGKGTFIAPPKLNYRLDKYGSWVHDWPSEGRKVEVKIQAFQELPCPSWAARRLHRPEQDVMVYMKRTRFVDGVPFSLEDVFIVPEVGRQLTREELEQNPISREVAERKLGLHFGGTEIEIDATVARPSEAGPLQVEPGAPLFLRWWTVVTDSHVPVLTAKALQRADLHRYSLFIPLSAQVF